MRAPTALVLTGCLLAATCGVASLTENSEPEPEMPQRIDRVTTSRDIGERAYRHVKRLVGFGGRHTGSPGWEKAVDYIAAQLRINTRLRPVRDRWTDKDHGLTFENIHVTIPGRSPHRIILGCHHDTKKCEDHPDPEHNFEFVGANDSGSGVGLLLELAAELARGKHEATLQLVFFDGEESLEFDWNIDQALFGSRRFVARERDREIEAAREGKIYSRVRAMVLLDMIGATDLQIDWEENSTPALRSIFRAAARACGHEKVFFAGKMPITDDHIPFLDAGIPAIDLIDLVDNPQWHTADDTLEHISAKSLQLVGEVVMTALPAIEKKYFARPRGRLDLPGKKQ